MARRQRPGCPHPPGRRGEQSSPCTRSIPAERHAFKARPISSPAQKTRSSHATRARVCRRPLASTKGGWRLRGSPPPSPGKRRGGCWGSVMKGSWQGGHFSQSHIHLSHPCLFVHANEAPTWIITGNPVRHPNGPPMATRPVADMGIFFGAHIHSPRRCQLDGEHDGFIFSDGWFAGVHQQTVTTAPPPAATATHHPSAPGCGSCAPSPRA